MRKYLPALVLVVCFLCGCSNVTGTSTRTRTLLAGALDVVETQIWYNRRLRSISLALTFNEPGIYRLVGLASRYRDSDLQTDSFAFKITEIPTKRIVSLRGDWGQHDLFNSNYKLIATGPHGTLETVYIGHNRPAVWKRVKEGE